MRDRKNKYFGHDKLTVTVTETVTKMVTEMATKKRCDPDRLSSDRDIASICNIRPFPMVYDVFTKFSFIFV